MTLATGAESSRATGEVADDEAEGDGVVESIVQMNAKSGEIIQK